nr:DUF6804 family protein [Aureisphaera galaxeae]
MGILHLPIEYYTFLRIVVFIGSLWVILSRVKTWYWVALFSVVAIVFNPIYPVYLYQKSKWIPIDIVVGILFLLQVFAPKKRTDQSQKATIRNEKILDRDRMV